MSGTLPPILVELRASSGEFMRKMGEARAEVTKLGTSGSAHMAKFAAIGKAALLGTAVAAVGIGVASVHMAAEFQSAMELVHTQAGASQAEVKKLSGAVLDLAGKTATAPNELAAGLYHLESSGLRGAKAMEALKVSAEGAKVGHADLESVTNALNAVIASGVKGASNMSGAMGMLNATVGAGDMRMQDLADAMGTGVLTVAKNFGVSLNDVGAALAVFGDNNIRGADAATKLSQAITYMEKPAKGADKVFKTFGMTSKQLRADIGKGGLALALKDLHDHLNKAGIKGTKVGPILLDAFGRKPAGAINTLLGQFSRFQSKQEEVRGGAKNFGEDWSATTKTFSFQVDQLKTQLEVLGVKIGTALIPVVRRLATDVMGVVNWFEKHTTIAKILAVAIGSVLVVAIMAYTVSMAAAAVATIAATWPILAIIAAVALVGVGIYELATHWHQVWGAISSFTKHIGSDIANALHFGAIKHGAEVAFDGVKSAAQAVAHFFTGTFLHAIGEFVSVFITGVRYLFVVWTTVVGGIIDGAAKALGWVPGVGGKLKAAAKAFDGFRDDVNNKLAQVAHDASTWGTTTGYNIGTGLVAGMNATDAAVVSAASGLGAKAIAAIKAKARVQSPSKETFYIGKMIGQGLIEGIKEREAALKKKLDNLVQRLNTVRDAARQMSASIGDGLNQGAALANMPQITNADGTSSDDTSVAGASAFMQANLDQLKAFYANLATDKNKGLSADLLQQFAGMGVEKGGGFAASVAAASGGDIANLDHIQADIAATSANIGKLVAGATFDGQIGTLAKRVDAAETSYKTVDRLAKAVEAALKHDRPLKLHLYLDGKEMAVVVRQELQRTKARSGKLGLS